VKKIDDGDDDDDDDDDGAHRQQNNYIILDWTVRINSADENVLNFHGLKMADTSKDGLLLEEEYITSQLHRCARAEVNKFLLAYVITC